MAKRSRQESVSTPSRTDSTSTTAQLTPSSTAETAPATKYVELDSQTKGNSVMQCYLPPHATLSFASYSDYDVHYQKAHVNRCAECHKNFPSEHYLHLHISENHDPLREARAARGDKTFACFVEDCERLCSTPQKRKMHVIDKHGFPKFYDFFVVNDGIDKRNSVLRRDAAHRRRSSAAANGVQSTPKVKHVGNPSQHPTAHSSSRAENMSVDENEEDDDNEEEEEEEESDDASDKVVLDAAEGPVRSSTTSTGSSQRKQDSDLEAITKSMSALQFVPPSVSFGRRKGRGGFARS